MAQTSGVPKKYRKTLIVQRTLFGVENLVCEKKRREKMSKILDLVVKYFPWGFGLLYLALLFLALVLSFILTGRYFKNRQNNKKGGDFIITPRFKK